MSAPTILAHRGDSLTWTFTVASDITGWTPRWTAKPLAGYASAADTAAVLTATTGSGLTVTQATPTGIITLSIAAATMAAIDPGVYAWDLQLTSGASVRTVEWDSEGTTVGTLTVSADVTRTTP